MGRKTQKLQLLLMVRGRDEATNLKLVSCLSYLLTLVKYLKSLFCTECSKNDANIPGYNSWYEAHKLTLFSMGGANMPPLKHFFK